jgi:hypothetical protein
MSKNNLNKNLAKEIQESDKQIIKQQKKPCDLKDPIFSKLVNEAILRGQECFEHKDYGHVCLDRM